MLLTIAFILLVLWLVGLLAHIGGGLVWLLIIAAVVVFLFDHSHQNRL